jgi:hypothetical protein
MADIHIFCKPAALALQFDLKIFAHPYFKKAGACQRPPKQKGGKNMTKRAVKAQS